MSGHLNAAAMAVRGAGTEASAEPAFSDPLVLVLPGAPKGKGRPRFWNGRAVTPEATRAYELALGTIAMEAMGNRPPTADPVAVLVVAMMPIPASWPKARRLAALVRKLWPTVKPDGDNILKGCLDALNGIVFQDDRQVIDQRILKFYGAEPMLFVKISPPGDLDPGAFGVPV